MEDDSQVVPLFCVACGSVDKVKKPSNRRNIESVSSRHVFPLWKSLLTNALEKSDSPSDVEQLLQQCLVMCKKCFYAYEKHIESLENMSSQLEKAVELLVGQSSGTSQGARKRTASSKPTTSTKRLQLEHSDESTSSRSPDVVVQVKYAGRTASHVLTPSRKPLGKAVARSSWKSAALKILKDKNGLKYCLKKIGIMIRNELHSMCSSGTDSILCSQSISDLEHFTWDQLHQELAAKAPTFLSILLEATVTKTERPNRNAVVGMCAAIVLKHRYFKFSLVQKILSLILYAGHSGKQVYDRLQKVGLVVSHSVTLRWLKKLASTYDSEIVSWRNRLADNLDVFEECPSFGASWGRNDSSSECSSTSSSSDTDNESSVASITPPSYSEDEPEEDELGQQESVDVDDDNEQPGLISIQATPTAVQVEQEDCHCDALGCKGYKLVGDNFDKNVKARYIRHSSHQNRSLHFFHVCAIEDRIDFSHIPNQHPHGCLNSPRKRALALLPSTKDDNSLRKNFAILLSRLLYSNMKFFRFTFDGAVNWHITHTYSKEMASKSKIVPLGILPLNETKNSDMVEIMEYMHQYVPTKEVSEQTSIPISDDPITISKTRMEKLLFGGDQLTVARARGAKKTRINSTSSDKCLNGLIPCIEDWHTKLVLIEVIWKYFYSDKSASEHGTLYQLRNLLNRVNVPKKPKKNFDACDDFLCTVLHSLLLLASLKVLGMQSLDDNPQSCIVPNCENLWMETAERRSEILEEVSLKIIDSVVSFRFTGGKEKFVDKVYDYNTKLLSLGCFYLEYCDAIREGDGTRVYRCWKYLLPIFKNSGRKNYSLEALYFLNQYKYELPPREAERLLWSRFVNTHGVGGCNIPGDLCLEHLNRLCKEAVKDKGPNKSEKAISFAAKILGVLKPVTEQFDMQNNVAANCGSHTCPIRNEDRNLIINKLSPKNVFYSQNTKREHKTFPKPKDVLHVSETWILEWMEKHI